MYCCGEGGTQPLDGNDAVLALIDFDESWLCDDYFESFSAALFTQLVFNSLIFCFLYQRSFDSKSDSLDCLIARGS